ncbi:MAG TPA: phospholipid carrier-dependent glycosyltransferase [Vicinamibacterales bacterium]|nr:phospholipid carrier-dependent glycosyltransferase [Vicinamibacterales bacterium]
MSRLRWWHLAAGLALALAFLGQCLAFVAANGQTYDEGVTLAAGLRLLETGRDDVNVEHPPLAKIIVAAPVRLFSPVRLDVARWAARGESGFGLGRDLFYNSGISYRQLLWLGRAPVVVLSLALLALLGAFAWRLWGARAAVLAVGLAAFDPTLIANGSLIALDAPLTLWVTAGFFCVNEWIGSRRPTWLLLTGLFAGLAAATKHSAPVFAAMMCVAMAAHALTTGDLPAWWNDTRPSGSRAKALGRAAGNGLIVLLTGLLVVRAVMGGAGWEPYLAGLRAQLGHQDQGHPAFFLGELSRTGWIAYFPVAILMKLPPLTLVLACASALAFRRGVRWGRAGSVVLVPLVCLTIGLLFARIDIGVRYALPLWPLFILSASRVATFPVPASRGWQALLVIGFAQHPVAAARIAPHDLAFFSDLVGGPGQGQRYLADSNLDWGQDISTLGAWLATRERPRRLYLAYFGTADPRAYGVRYRPAPNSCPHPAPWVPEPEPATGRELLAVSAMNLQGVFFGDTGIYGWLAARRPLAILGHSISVYDITDDADAHAALARLYDRFGPVEWAAEERSRAVRLRAGMP